MKSIFTAMMLILSFMAGTVAAETHVVEMRNASGTDSNHLNVFSPPILKIQAGDKVRFVVVDAGHNSASKRGMIPDGADAWNGAIDEELELSFDVEGTYGYVCLPHYDMGMVGLILVGDYSINLKQAKKVRHIGKAKKAFRKLFKELEAQQAS